MGSIIYFIGLVLAILAVIDIIKKTISLVDDRGLLTQLAAYEATYNPRTGNVSYNAPPGLHDDCCISTMLALDALTGAGRTGQYVLGFRNARR